MVEAKSISRFVRISPRKARQVMDLIRNQPVPLAMQTLALTPRRAARIIEKTMKSAVANAVVLEGSGRLEPSDLRVTRATVDEGATMKRWMPRAQGRATQMRRRTSHFTIMVAGEAKPGPAARRGAGRGKASEAAGKAGKARRGTKN